MVFTANEDGLYGKSTKNCVNEFQNIDIQRSLRWWIANGTLQKVSRTAERFFISKFCGTSYRNGCPSWKAVL